MNILKEIIKGEQKVRTIDHGDRKIVFELNRTEDIVFVLIVKEENAVIWKKLYALIKNFDDYYKEQIKDIKKTCMISHNWLGTQNLIEKHFKS